MEREAFIALTIDWLGRRLVPAGAHIDADTPLFERGLVDSLGILRLIAWTERAIGRRIPDREVRMDRFGSVRAIADNYLTATSRPAVAACGHVCGRAQACLRRCA
jgi:acyl carrier protein